MNISNTDNRYPALKIVSGWLRITAWVTVIFTGIATLMVLFQGGFGFVAAIGILVSGGFLAILQFAIAESVIVLVDIEQNTRNSALNAASKDNMKPHLTEPISKNTDDTIHAKSMASSNLTDQQLMDSFGITFDGENYHFMEYKYQNLKDAVNYAKNQSRKV